MPSFKDLVSPLSTEEVRDSIYSVLTTLGLTPSDWAPGDPEAAIVWSVSTVTSQLWNKYGTPAIRSGFLDFAAGAWLQGRASQGYSVEFIPATFASGEWTGTNGGISTLGPYAPGDLVFVHTTSGKTYKNTGTVSFPSSVPTTIAISAVEVGTPSDAAPGAIVLQTVVIGLTGSNVASVLGRDDETDAALRERCRLRLGELSPNGPKSAYEYVALTPTDPRGRWNHGVTVTKVTVVPAFGNGEVSVLLAGPNGAITGPEVALVDDAIQKNAVPECISATVVSATPVVVAITYTVFCPTGQTAAEIEANVALALARLFRDLRIGGSVLPSQTGKLFLNVIESTILGAVPGALQVEVTLPVANVVLTASQVAVLGTVTGSVVYTS